MLIHNPIFTGSISLNGSDISKIFTVSTDSSSFASRITNNESTSSAFVVASGSLAARLTSNESITGSFATTSSLALTSSSVAAINARTGSFATTGSNQFNGSQTITGSLTATGTIVAQTLVVQTITSSIVYSSGSNIFGLNSGNSHQFTGSMLVSGSGAFVGALILNSTISNGTYTYTLPSATGTLALTSQLSSYLPLSGGTLTGALSGTSATFSNTVSVSHPSLWGAIELKGSSNIQGGQVDFYGGTVRYSTITGEYESSTNGQLVFRTLKAGALTTAFTIASTGAATFSGVGSASNGTINLISSDAFIRLNSTGGTANKSKWDIRNISAIGYESLDFRTIDDANTVFVSRFNVSYSGVAYVNTTDYTGQRTSATNVLVLTAESPSLPYGGFGGSIIFNNRAYNSGIVTSTRIRSQINNNSFDNFGGSLIFDVTPSVGGTLTPALTLNYSGAATFSSSVTATSASFSGNVSSLGIFSGRTSNGQAFGCGNGVDSDMGIFVQTGNIAFSNSGTASGISFALGGTTRFSIASTGAATFSSSVTVGTDIRTDGGTVQVGAGSTNYYTRISTVYNYPYVDSYLDSMAGASYDGRLTFRIQRNGGAVNPVMTIMPAGNVGIGTTAPSVLLQVGEGSISNNTANQYLRVNAGVYNAASTSNLDLFNFGNNFGNALGWRVTSGTESIGITVGRYLSFNTVVTDGSGNPSTSSERMRITSAGNVGIGTTAPFSQGSGATAMELAGNTYGQFFVSANSASIRGVVMARASTLNDVYIASITNSPLLFGTNDTERMRITSGGIVCVGTSSPIGSSANTSLGATFALSYNWLAVTDSNYIQRSNGTDGQFLTFYKGNSIVGSVSVVGSTTFYNVSSDYRLKEDLKPIKGLELINKIKVYDYKWKSDNSRMDGVLAHELAEVLPYAVQGIKDGEQIQQVDYSKIVPVMVQAIKELKAKIETLENK